MFVLRATPIEVVIVAFGNRIPRGITFGYAARDYCSITTSIILQAK